MSDEDLAQDVFTEILGSVATDVSGVTVDIFRIVVQDFITSSKTFKGNTIKFLQNPTNFWVITSKEYEEMLIRLFLMLLWLI